MRFGHVRLRFGDVNLRFGLVIFHFEVVNLHFGFVKLNLDVVNFHLEVVKSNLGLVNTHFGFWNWVFSRLILVFGGFVFGKLAFYNVIAIYNPKNNWVSLQNNIHFYIFTLLKTG